MIQKDFESKKNAYASQMGAWSNECIYNLGPVMFDKFIRYSLIVLG